MLIAYEMGGIMEGKGLGKRINMVRKDRGFTADRLSELCNINATYLRQIEGGTVEHLREGEGHDKVVGGVADKEEKGRPFIPKGVQPQLVIAHNLPKLRNVEGSQSGAA